MNELMEIPTLNRRLKLLTKENAALKAELDRTYGTRQSIYIRHLSKENSALKREIDSWRQAGEDAIKQLGTIIGLASITALLTKESNASKTKRNR